jgi:putative ABC transport system permease protein
MSFVDLRIAARSLAQHAKRSLLLGTAIAGVTLLLVLALAVTDGVQETILRSSTTLMTGHVNVGGFYKVAAGASIPLVTDYQQVLEDLRPEVPELDWAVARGRGNAKVVSDTSSMDLVLSGVDLARDRGFRSVLDLAEGSVDDLARPNGILLFKTVAKRLGVKVGDNLTISAPTFRGMANTMDVHVAAIAKDMGILSYFNAYLSSSSLQALYQLKAGSTGAVFLYLQDHRDAPQVAARVREILARKGHRVMDADPQPYFVKLYGKVNKEDWTGQKLDISTWSDETGFMSQTVLLLQTLIGFMILVLELIIGAGVMSTMWIAIRERTREIGTLRAIGMQRRRVLWMFLAEAGLLGAAGALVGAVGAVVLGAILNATRIGVPEAIQWILMGDHLVLSLHSSRAAQAVVGLTLLTAAAAILPAVRASRLAPITAMHHIG